jgi:hypothetical protein
MICFAKPLLAENFYAVQKEDSSVTCYKYDKYNLIFSSERILHKGSDSSWKKSQAVSLKKLGVKKN